MAVPHKDGTGHTKVLIKAEYEWKPPLLAAPKHATNEVTTKPVVGIQTNNPFDALHDDEVSQGKEGESSVTGKEEGLFSLHNESNDESDSEVKEAWNIRGLNRAPKQSEVLHIVNKNQLSLCVILESHVDLSSLSSVCSKVFKF
ncbi:hypothetical protein Tco_1580370 [Tanacetum coccineum]